MIPDLVFEYPDCSVCLTNLYMGGDNTSFWCEKCGATWDLQGRDGRREE